MRVIKSEDISVLVADLCVKASLVLRNDILKALRLAYNKETNRKAKDVLSAIIENAHISNKENIAICQDTGIPCVFVELGQEVKVIGNLKQAINKGVESGYKSANLRNSLVRDPLSRGSSGYTPAVIHFDIIPGDKLKVIVLPKGFGCENKSQLKMFRPTATIDELKKFIIDSVRLAGPDACPPYVVGVGIGGTADYVSLLAKKALLRKISKYPSSLVSRRSSIIKLEADLLNAVNKLNIGPMGLGGKTTALAVHIETSPTHIAGLPVAINVSCHALRSAQAAL